MNQQMWNNNFFANFQRFMQNPSGYLQVPQSMANDPDAVIQYLMDTGKINQQQYMQAKQRGDQIKNNPMFRQFFNH